MSDEDLMGRLRAYEEYGDYDLLMNSRPERLRNPDGPAAADVIQRLTRERDELKVAGDNILRGKIRLRADLRKEQEAVLFVAGQREAAERKVEKLRETSKDALAYLVAAVSLLRRGGKKAAPSDKMFEQMLADYEAAIVRARAALAETEKD